jgi:hypothetical protein
MAMIVPKESPAAMMGGIARIKKRIHYYGFNKVCIKKDNY